MINFLLVILENINTFIKNLSINYWKPIRTDFHGRLFRWKMPESFSFHFFDNFFNWIRVILPFRTLWRQQKPVKSPAAWNWWRFATDRGRFRPVPLFPARESRFLLCAYRGPDRKVLLGWPLSLAQPSCTFHYPNIRLRAGSRNKVFPIATTNKTRQNPFSVFLCRRDLWERQSTNNTPLTLT